MLFVLDVQYPIWPLEFIAHSFIHFYLYLVPSSPPQKVQCTPMSSTSLLINWSPPPVSEMNGVLKEYRLSYRPLREWEGNNVIANFHLGLIKSPSIRYRHFVRCSRQIKVMQRK